MFYIKHFLVMYFTSSIADDIRVPLQVNVVSLVLLHPRRHTTQRSLSNDETLHHCGAGPPGSISRRLRSSSPPPIAKSAGASSPTNPITLRSTWLRQRGCTLDASLFYSTCYIYCPLSTQNNVKYDYFLLLYDKK